MMTIDRNQHRIVCERGKDLPGPRAFLGFVPTGDLAGDYGWAQLAFREIIGGIDAIVVQKGQEMIALFVEPFAEASSLLSRSITSRKAATKAHPFL
jgi:hypothetical protein